MTIAEAKQRLDIHGLWELLQLDGKPSNSCRCPWREDRNASFSITPTGDAWHDFATGEKGDAVSFLERVLAVSNREACKRFLGLAGGIPFDAGKVCRVTLKRSEPERSKPIFPTFDLGNPGELEALSALRSIPVAGLQWALDRGVLRFLGTHGHRAWVVTDSSGWNAQARRLDGKPWEHLGGSKNYTLPGSRASWPIGLKEAEPYPAIALVEGAPDLLAAHYEVLREQVSHPSLRDVQCAPVAILGAGNKIPDEALEMFRGKIVWIYGHADEAGQQAAGTWATQLESVGANVGTFSFVGLVCRNGAPCKDLNDLLNLNPEGFDLIGENVMPKPVSTQVGQTT